MPLLDGEFVENDKIDPKLHRFLGTFRYPSPPDPRESNLMCPCGEVLKYVGQEHSHWQNGHFDIPQYVIIKDGGVR